METSKNYGRFILALTAIMTLALACQKEEIQPSTMLEESSLSTRSEGGDASYCQLNVGEAMTVSTVYSYALPTFTSMVAFESFQDALDSKYNDLCVTSESFLDLTQPDYVSAWDNYVQVNDGFSESLDTFNAKDPVRLSLMNSDGFTRIGDTLYHWASDYESYSIGLNQPQAYEYLKGLGNSVADLAELTSLGIEIVDSEVRELITTNCSVLVKHDTDNGCDNANPLVRSSTILFYPSLATVSGTIDWGDGTIEQITVFHPNPGKYGPVDLFHTYPSTGEYVITMDLDLTYVDNTQCQSDLSYTEGLGNSSCIPDQEEGTFFLNEFGSGLLSRTWNFNTRGMQVFIKKGRTITRSRFRANTYYATWVNSNNGGRLTATFASDNLTLNADWRDDDCTIRDVDAETVVNPSTFGQRRIIVKPSSRSFRNYFGNDLHFDVEVTFDANTVISEVFYIPFPGC